MPQHPRPIAYAVNFDPDEADPTKIERQELRGLLGGAPLVFAENPDDLSGTFALLREGKSLWGAVPDGGARRAGVRDVSSNRFSCKAATSSRG